MYLAVLYSKMLTIILNEVIQVQKSALISIFSDEDKISIKKADNILFHKTMWLHDSGEICKLAK